MKKIISVLLAVVMLFSFAACGSSEPFECDFCGHTITEGKKYVCTDSYGDKWNACENCRNEMKSMKQGFEQ